MECLASPFGYVAFEWNPDALGVTANGEHVKGALTHLEIRQRGRVTSSRCAAARGIRRWLDGDFGALGDIPVLQPGTAFKQEVWQAMRLIPAGKVVSYAELAAQTSSPAAVRAAATACATNHIPLVVPCHRIIRSDGLVGNYALGASMKVALLQYEGVEVF